MGAIPFLRFPSDARNTSYFERVMPGPKIATGQPPGGGVPVGVTSANPTRSARTAVGPDPPVGGVGIVRELASSHWGASKAPNAYDPAFETAGRALSKTCSLCVLPLPMSSVRVLPTTGPTAAAEYAAG